MLETIVNFFKSLFGNCFKHCYCRSKCADRCDCGCNEELENTNKDINNKSLKENIEKK